MTIDITTEKFLSNVVVTCNKPNVIAQVQAEPMVIHVDLKKDGVDGKDGRDGIDSIDRDVDGGIIY
jgi:hypothetical protein